MESLTCSVCARTPLVGESVTIVCRDELDSSVCDLCAEKPRAAILGEPIRRERMRSAVGAARVTRLGSGVQTSSPALPAGVS